MFLIR